MFSETEKVQIKCWSDTGIPATEIAARLGRNAAAVRKIIAKLRELPVGSPPLAVIKKSGRPSKTSPRKLKRLQQYVNSNPFKTAKEVRREVVGWSGVSVRTIQRTLQKKLGLPSRRAAAKPLLTPAMVKKRLSFCKKHLHWTEKDWENVMFSDESMFRIINPRAQMVRRPRAVSRYLNKYTRKTMKHPAGVMIWGCFSGKGGRGALYLVPKGAMMNADRYIAVLEEKLFPWMQMQKVDKFLQDGAPCHKAKRVMALLKQQPFTVMDWPGNSPDLNPIENLWSIMKAKLKEDHTITSLPALEKAIKVMWTMHIKKELCLKLAHSMPRRLQACIANGGQMTKY